MSEVFSGYFILIVKKDILHLHVCTVRKGFHLWSASLSGKDSEKMLRISRQIFEKKKLEQKRNNLHLPLALLTDNTEGSGTEQTTEANNAN